MLGVSLAATLATLPLIAFHFERVSTLSVPASVLTLPALPFLIAGSAGTAFAGLVNTTAAMPIGWVAWGAGAYLSSVVTLLAELPGASVEIGNLPSWAVVVYYGGLALTYLGRRLTGWITLRQGSGQGWIGWGGLTGCTLQTVTSILTFLRQGGRT